MAFRVTDADVARTCTIGNRAVASRGSSRLSPRRKSKEPLSRWVPHVGIPQKVAVLFCLAKENPINKIIVLLFPKNIQVKLHKEDINASMI